jgi:putative nucleic acid binding protein
VAVPAGDDLTIVLFFATLVVGFGLETMKAETAPRKVIFAVMTAVCLLSAVFWLQIKTIWPPFTDATISVGTNPLAWFISLMFILAVLAFHPAKPRNRAAAVLPTSSNQPANADKLKEQEKPEEKVIINVTAEYLIDLYRGRTTIHADALAAMYLGKWITVNGKVANVWKSTGGYRVIILAAGDYDKLVTCNFGENAHVAYFTRDSEIAAQGKISSISSTGLDMIKCDLIG